MRTNLLKVCAAGVLTTVLGLGQTSKPQTFQLVEASGLITKNVKAVAVEFKGRRAVQLTKEGYDDGFAVLPGTDFQDGEIEADIALKLTAPPGARMPGFIGIAFRARPDAAHYELFYLRPGNAGAEDQAMRNHAVQYSAEPGFPWFRLRREWPSVYEASADLKLETWTHVRIEVAGRTAKLYLNGSAMPTLIVNGLKGEDLRGVVALWGYANEDAYFSNVRITPAVAQAVKNGADIAGTWDVRYTGDAIALDGSMKLGRDGGKVTGIWSGPLGRELAATGTWRDGYAELSFVGEWPKDNGLGPPGPATVFLEGWIDSESAKGRMRIEGRSDGQWAAKRKK